MQGSPQPSTRSPKESRNLYCLLLTLLLSLIFILSLSSSSSSPSHSPSLSLLSSSSLRSALSLSSSPPSLAYLISGSDGDGDRLLRLLRAAYHPRNIYLLHLDIAAPQSQRDALARAVAAIPAFRSAGNVHVVGRPDAANNRGSSALAATLHAAAVLLRISPNWDWFVNLDASDYPLVTQDDLLHIFSFLPKDLNFVQHSSYIGWLESRRLKLIAVDPGLYHSSKADIFYATQKRELPNAFKLFTGSGSVILSRKFTEYCILGTDNLPRILLMYYANTASSHTNYFQTVLCNSPEFNRTIVNHHLHYELWDNSPPRRRGPRALTLNDSKNMSLSGKAFATRFSSGDPLLDDIDREVLGRGGPDKIVPGGWCLGPGDDPCKVWGDTNVLKPSPGATKLARLVQGLLSNGTFHRHQCI